MTTSPALQRIGVIPRRRPSKRIAGRKRDPGQHGSRPMVDEAQGRRPRRRQPYTGWSSGSAGHGGRRDHACAQRAGGVMTLCDPACLASSVGMGPSTTIGPKRSGLDCDSEAAEDHALPVEGPVRRNMLHAPVDHRLVHAFDARPALRPVDSRQDHRAALCQSANGLTPGAVVTAITFPATPLIAGAPVACAACRRSLARRCPGRCRSAPSANGLDRAARPQRSHNSAQPFALCFIEQGPP